MTPLEPLNQADIWAITGQLCNGLYTPFMLLLGANVLVYCARLFLRVTRNVFDLGRPSELMKQERKEKLKNELIEAYNADIDEDNARNFVGIGDDGEMIFKDEN